MAHAHDQTLDDQCPRHFHLHLCPGPSTPLAKNLQVSDFLKSGNPLLPTLIEHNFIFIYWEAHYWKSFVNNYRQFIHIFFSELQW